MSFVKAHPFLTVLFSSTVWALCYPPFPLGPLAFVVLVPALLAIANLTPRRAFLASFIGGLAYNTLLLWWIYNVMKVGPALVIGLGLLLLIVFLSLFNGAMGLAFKLSQGRPFLLILFPLAWAGLEVARSLGEMSFPWNYFGYTLGNWVTFIQPVSLFGVYGLSALLVAANLCGYFALTSKRTHQKKWMLAWVFIPVSSACFGLFSLKQTPHKAPTFDVSLIQPAIPQTKKWNEQYFNDVMAKTFRIWDGTHGDLSEVSGSDLIVLAETAIPDFLRSRPEMMDSISVRALKTKSPVMVGALDFVMDKKPWREYVFYNSAFLFSPIEGQKAKQYSKLRLVPFSEKLPFDNIFPILNYVNLGEGDFSAGDSYQVWGDRIRFAPSICYEVIYPDYVRQAKKAGAQVLINITNDGWFGRSNGPYQHAAITRFRAAESGIPIARCANGGISVFYDAWGRDLGHTKLLDSTLIRRKLPVPNRNTFYAQHGDGVDRFFLVALTAWMLLVLTLGLKRGQKTKI